MSVLWPGSTSIVKWAITGGFRLRRPGNDHKTIHIMIENIRAALLRRSLRHLLATQKRRRKTHTLDSAHTIGILFDATEEKDRQEVLHFAHALESPVKKVRLLGFIDIKKVALGQTQFPQFTQKERKWNGLPGSEAVHTFINEHFDLLLCLNGKQVMLMEWIAAASQAAMKIGTYTAHPNDFDLMLETPAQKGVRFFMDQLDLYLDKIIPTKYESASAL